MRYIRVVVTAATISIFVIYRQSLFRLFDFNPTKAIDLVITTVIVAAIASASYYFERRFEI